MNSKRAVSAILFAALAAALGVGAPRPALGQETQRVDATPARGAKKSAPKPRRGRGAPDSESTRGLPEAPMAQPGDAVVRAPISVDVDATEAPRRIFHTKVTVPAQPGPLTLAYPMWLPGEHGPTGPINQVAGLVVTAEGKTIPWRRDSVDLFSITCDVPAGARSVEVAFDYLSPSATSGFTASASATPQLAVISWNTLLMYPRNARSDDLKVSASLRVPKGWKFGTALPVRNQNGSNIDFNQVSLTTLVDSPVLTGAHYRMVPLTDPGVTPSVELDMASDSEAALEIKPETVEGYKHLVAEANALFGAHHYDKYHFLVTLSDGVSSFGLEHHESSDDRSGERSLIDEDELKGFSGLLPHEYVHSWNGKYRRPAGLATANYQEPMRDDLLWVYEGLTEYLGYVLTVRSGLQTEAEFRDDLAHVAALLDNKSGRRWRPLQDTATAASLLYGSPGEWSNYRRGVDFYDEGVLLWLDVDTTIRLKSNNTKSIEDFVRAFHGAPSTGPAVKPYTFEDVVAALNAVVPNDWAAFLTARLNSTDPHVNSNGLANAGWRLAYTSEPNLTEKASAASGKGLDLGYTLGLRVNGDGQITDTSIGMPGDKAGLSPGANILAVNGRKYSNDVMKTALEEAKSSNQPIELIAENGGFYKTYRVQYAGGAKNPHLERDASRPDLIGAIAKPLAR